MDLSLIHILTMNQAPKEIMRAKMVATLSGWERIVAAYKRPVTLSKGTKCLTLVMKKGP